MTSSVTPDVHNAVFDLLSAVKFLKDDEDKEGFAACWSRNAKVIITLNGQAMSSLHGRDEIVQEDGAWRIALRESDLHRRKS